MSKFVFFEMARTGRPFSKTLWVRLLIAIGIIMFSFVALNAAQLAGYLSFMSLAGNGALPGVPAGTNPLEDPASMSPTVLGILLMLLFGLASILTLLWVRLVERRSIASFGLGNPLGGLAKFARGGLLGLAAMAAIAYGLTGAGMAEMTAPSVPQSWLAVGPLLVLILGWSIQGSTEELVTRGLLFQSIGARNGLIAGLIISSAFFSLIHGLNPNTTPLFFVNLIAYSLFVCFYCLREGSLWGACGFHAIWNFAQGDIFGFAVSGMQMGSDKLMRTTPTGPDYITGGATGPEGGLATTIVLVLSALAVLVLVKPDADAYKLAEKGDA